MEESNKVTPIRKAQRSPRGTAIASRNASKSGIYSESAPILASADKALYDELYQGFVAEFQPQHLSEYSLVQCAAMALLRLSRVWAAQSKEAELAQLQEAKAQGFPDTQDAALQHLKKVTMAAERRHELERLEAGISEAAIASAEVKLDRERQDKRERHLARLLDNAIDSLKNIKKERQQEVFSCSIRPS